MNKATLPGRGSYYGGKNGDGIYQRIINLIPPHKILVEAMSGSAAITRMIKPAEKAFLIEIDQWQCDLLRAELRDRAVVINGDYKLATSIANTHGRGTFIFCDPPYLKDVRTSKRDIYFKEWSYEDHAEFLEWLRYSRVNTMVTHPRCLLYESSLGGWSTIDYKYMSRGGVRKDTIWMNYDTPKKLHDYSYIGDSRTERQQISRKIKRWVGWLAALPCLEREAIIERINENYK